MARALPLTVTHSIHWDATPSTAYALVAHGQRRPAWLRELSATDAPDRPLELDDRFRGRTSLLRHSFAGEGHVVRAEAGAVLEEEVVVGARFTSTWSFEPDGDGTTVSHVIAIECPTGPLGRLARWILRRRLAAMQRSSLTALTNLRQ